MIGSADLKSLLNVREDLSARRFVQTKNLLIRMALPQLCAAEAHGERLCIPSGADIADLGLTAAKGPSWLRTTSRGSGNKAANSGGSPPAEASHTGCDSRNQELLGTRDCSRGAHGALQAARRAHVRSGAAPRARAGARADSNA